MITLSKLREEYELKNIDFLKIDCENIDESIIMQTDLSVLDCNFLSVESIASNTVWVGKLQITRKKYR